MDSHPTLATIATADTDQEINSLVTAFKEKLKIKDVAKQKEQDKRRADRKQRIEKGEEDVTSDTEDEFDGESEEIVVELK